MTRQYTGCLSVPTSLPFLLQLILNSSYFVLGFSFCFFSDFVWWTSLYFTAEIRLWAWRSVTHVQMRIIPIYLCLSFLIFHRYVLLTLFIRSKNFLWCVWPGIRACPGTHSFATYFTFSMLVLVSTVWDFYDHVLFFKLYHSKVWAVVVPNWLNFGLGPFSDCMLEGMFEHKGAYST